MSRVGDMYHVRGSLPHGHQAMLVAPPFLVESTLGPEKSVSSAREHVWDIVGGAAIDFTGDALITGCATRLPALSAPPAEKT